MDLTLRDLERRDSHLILTAFGMCSAVVLDTGAPAGLDIR